VAPKLWMTWPHIISDLAESKGSSHNKGVHAQTGQEYRSNNYKRERGLACETTVYRKCKVQNLTTVRQYRCSFPLQELATQTTPGLKFEVLVSRSHLTTRLCRFSVCTAVTISSLSRWRWQWNTLFPQLWPVLYCQWRCR
jgi:hypothetical protein